MVDYKNNLMLNHIQLPNVSSDRNVVNLNTNADNILTQNEGLLSISSSHLQQCILRI